MKRIFYFPTRYFPAISGAEFYIQRIAEIFDAHNLYDVEIHASNAIDFNALRNEEGFKIHETNTDYSKVNGLKVQRHPIHYSFNLTQQEAYVKSFKELYSLEISDKSLKNLLNNGPFLKELLDSNFKTDNFNYNLIHCTFFPYFNLVISLLFSRRFKVPCICTPFFHFSNPRYLNNDLSQILTKFDYLIACTNLEKKVLMSSLGISSERIEVISMGVDHEKFSPSKKIKHNKYPFKQKYFLSGEQNYKMVLYCGYKNYEKGALSILHSIPYIIKKIRKVYFVFIGPPTIAFNRELSKLKRSYDVRIINFTPENMTGYFDKKKINAFKEADVYLMPSRSDAFGIAFLESWAASKPVIGANIGATPEVIQDKYDGLLVEFNNPVDIADKVITLLERKRLSKKFGERGRNKVVHNYTWEIVAKKTHNFYSRILNPTHRCLF